MKIIPLSEGSFTIDHSKLFVPFDQDKEDLQQRPVGSLLVEIQPFVVITSTDVLLLDMGLGFSRNGRMQLLQNLEDAGIEPGSITKVLLSHLHKDHAGAVTAEGHPEQLLLPKATYYVQKREMDFALEKGKPSFIPKEIAALRGASNVVWLEDDRGSISPGITYELTGAHSPYHQVFFIKDENHVVFFGGDDAPQLQQMKHRFVAKYDYDGKKAMELRREWWEKGKQEKWTFLFYHDVKNPVWKFE